MWTPCSLRFLECLIKEEIHTLPCRHSWVEVSCVLTLTTMSPYQNGFWAHLVMWWVVLPCGSVKRECIMRDATHSLHQAGPHCRARFDHNLAYQHRPVLVAKGNWHICTMHTKLWLLYVCFSTMSQYLCYPQQFHMKSKWGEHLSNEFSFLRWRRQTLSRDITIVELPQTDTFAAWGNPEAGSKETACLYLRVKVMCVSFSLQPGNQSSLQSTFCLLPKKG